MWPFRCRTCDELRKSLDEERKLTRELLSSAENERREFQDLLARAVRIPGSLLGEIPVGAPEPLRPGSATWSGARRHLERRDRKPKSETEKDWDAKVAKIEKEAGVGGEKTPDNTV
jgi:hypothetical protein